MTPEKAKKLIDSQTIVAGRRNGKTVQHDFILTVRKALDKQIPKPIAYRVRGGYLYLCMFPPLEPQCPTCGRDFAKYIEEPKHCPECGQALKWR
jgi:hypothetical protein